MPVLAEKDVRDLREAVRSSREDLRPFRENRRELVKLYTGRHYSKFGSDERQPLNTIELYVNTMTRLLGLSNPRALVTPKVRERRSKAKEFQITLNHLMKEIRLGKTLRRCGQQGMFGLAICEVGINPSQRIELGGFRHDPGQVYADSVSLDHWVHDTNALTYEQIQFAGRSFRMLWRDARRLQIFDPVARAKLKPETQRGTKLSGFTEYESHDIAHGRSGIKSAFMDTVELIKLWLPYMNLLVIIDACEGNDVPLYETEWRGPEGGPFHWLVFNEVPDNLMPLAPLSNLKDLHLQVNDSLRKVQRQALRQKKVVAYTGEAEKDAESLRDGRDSQYLNLAHLDKIKEFSFGGADPTNIAVMQQGRDLFSYAAGNLDTLAGLGPQANTLGQEELLAAASSVRAADMAERVLDFAREVVRDLGFYLYNDENASFQLTRVLEDVGLEVPFEFSADTREGDLMDYTIDIDVYSMRSRTPQQRLQQIQRYLDRVLGPYGQVALQQGMTIDFREIQRVYAEYEDLPEILGFAIDTRPEVPTERLGLAKSGAGRPPVTRSENTRNNVSGTTRQANESRTVEALMKAANNGGNGRAPS